MSILYSFYLQLNLKQKYTPNIWKLWSFYQKLAKWVVKPNNPLPVGLTTHLAKEGSMDLADKQKIG